MARVEAAAAAAKVQLSAAFLEAAAALSPPAATPQEHTAREMSVIAEVACVLTIGERAAGALLGASVALTTRMHRTQEALLAGDISWQHARIMVDEADCLDSAGAAILEAHFLEQAVPGAGRGCLAGELVPSRFRARVRAWRERHHPVSIEIRHATSVLDRRVEYAPERDGMAWISAYLPAATAEAIWNRTTATARGLQGPDEARTLTQLRADSFATGLLGSQAAAGKAADVPAPRAHVLVTVPVFALLGVTDEPADLAGHGPIPASRARELVANGAASFRRVLTDPRNGAPLEIARTSYRLTKAMRAWLRLRDGRCPFPGCNNHSLDNEADHILAWENGGTTGISNLGQPCRKHHRLRHTTAWQPTPATTNDPPGWTSPAGRHYPSEHQDWGPPVWPKALNLRDVRSLPSGAPPVGGSRPDFSWNTASVGEDRLRRFLQASPG